MSGMGKPLTPERLLRRYLRQHAVGLSTPECHCLICVETRATLDATRAAAQAGEPHVHNPTHCAACAALIPPAPVPAAGLREAIEGLLRHHDGLDCPVCALTECADVAVARAALLGTDRPGLDEELREAAQDYFDHSWVGPDDIGATDFDKRAWRSRRRLAAALLGTDRPGLDVERRCLDAAEHERQSNAGTHLPEPHCPFCFFESFSDPEERAEVWYARLQEAPDDE